MNRTGRAVALVCGLLLFALGGGVEAAERTRPARSSGWFSMPPPGSRLLWIAAHPDDEVLIAPVLGELCVDQGGVCTFLVLTRGEAGICLIPGGCHPTLAQVRSAEMEESARLFGAELILWDLADGTPGGAAAARHRWAAAMGGDDQLLARIGAEIDRVEPDLILTYDPRHGSTCHTDHQAVGALVLDALNLSETRKPRLYLLADQVRIEAGGTRIRFFRSLPDSVERYDANRYLMSVGGSAWAYMLTALAIHRSQFGAAEMSALESRPPHERMLHVLPFTRGARLEAGVACSEP